MPRGVDRRGDPRNDLSREGVQARWEIGKHRVSPDAPDRVGFHLTGGGYEPSWMPGHTKQRFGSHEEALSYVEKHGLQLKAPEPSTPPSDAGDVGWAGRKPR